MKSAWRPDADEVNEPLEEKPAAIQRDPALAQVKYKSIVRLVLKGKTPPSVCGCSDVERKTCRNDC